MSKKKKIKAITKKGVVEKSVSPDLGKQFLSFIEKLSPVQFNIVAILVIIVVGYLSYSNSLNGEMIFDDINIIQQNDRLHNLDDFKNINKWINPNTRHFCMLTFAINYSIHENSVFGYHLFNLIIHLIYGCFVFLLARLILSISIFDNNPQRKYSGLIAFFIALMCVLHPIQTQAVSYIVQRMTSMATMFYIMSLFFYGSGRLMYVKKGLNAKVVLLYLFALISGTLGILSKQIVITIPIVLLLFELFFIRNKDGAVFKKYLLISFSLLFLVFLVVLFGGFLPKETEIISRSDYLFTQFRVIVKYIQLFFIPVDQALDYDFSVSKNIFEWKVIACLLIILVLIIAAFLLYKKKHLISFGIFWLFITLSVESSILPIRDVINEHRLYLPLFGFSLIFVSIIWDFFARKRLYAVIVFFLVINIIYGFITYEQNKVWESKLSLWLDNTSQKPHNARSHSNLGSTYITLRDFEKAEEAYTEAVRLKPDYIEALHNLGNVKLDLGKPHEAILVFDQLITVDSTYFKAYYGRGFAYSNIQEYEKAISDFTNAFSPNNIEYNITVYNKSGLAKLSLQKYHEAISDFNEALKLKPEYAEAYNNKGLAYLEMQEHEEAIINFTKAIEFRLEFFEAYNNRGNAYFRLQLYEYALADYQRALELNPNEITILKNIAIIHYYNKNYEQAIEFYSKILSFSTQSANVLNDRGITYYILKDYEKAYADLIRARQLGLKTNPDVFKFLENYIKQRNAASDFSD